MQKDYYLKPSTINPDGSSPERQKFKSAGYNADLGIVAPNIYFKYDFQQELDKLEFYNVGNMNGDQRNLKPGYKAVSFKSHDGKPDTYFAKPTEDYLDEEKPEHYKWTDLRDQCPHISAVIDWFKVPKTRVRIFQMQPGHWMPGHTDMENARNTSTYGQVARIFVQLNDNSKAEFGHRLITQDSDISINLQQGHCLVFNQDKVTHSAWNMSKDTTRNLLVMLIKRNEWLDNIMNGRSQPSVIDVAELVNTTN